jgi:hypothetical protein
MKIAPFVTACEDYHNFGDVVRHFEDAGIPGLKFQEIKCGNSPIWQVGYAGYHAVFFLPEDKNKIEPLIAEWREKIKGY